MKKTIFSIVPGCLALFIILGGMMMTFRTYADDEMVDRGAIFINGVEIESKLLIKEEFAWERAGNRMVQTDRLIEVVYFPFQAILENLGSAVTLEESTGNIFFDFDDANYIAQFNRMQRDNAILISKVENMDSINNNDFLQLFSMSADGTYCIEDNTIYLTQDTGRRLFEELGCKVEIDLVNKIVKIYSSNEISIMLNGKPIQFDIAPIIEDGRTLVPLRAIFEALGATVEWNGDIQTVIAKKDDITVSLKIGSNELVKNGEIITLDIPTRLVGDRTLVPARVVAESFGAVVEWDKDTKTVTIKD